MNTRLFLQVAGKRDPEQEVEAQQWIETVVGEKFPAGKHIIVICKIGLNARLYLLILGLPFEYALRDGVFLCKLMNKLAPGIIPKINTTGGDYKMMDNISQ